MSRSSGTVDPSSENGQRSKASSRDGTSEGDKDADGSEESELRWSGRKREHLTFFHSSSDHSSFDEMDVLTDIPPELWSSSTRRTGRCRKCRSAPPRYTSQQIEHVHFKKVPHFNWGTVTAVQERSTNNNPVTRKQNAWPLTKSNIDKMDAKPLLGHIVTCSKHICGKPKRFLSCEGRLNYSDSSQKSGDDSSAPARKPASSEGGPRGASKEAAKAQCQPQTGSMPQTLVQSRMPGNTCSKKRTPMQQERRSMMHENAAGAAPSTDDSLDALSSENITQDITNETRKGTPRKSLNGSDNCGSEDTTSTPAKVAKAAPGSEDSTASGHKSGSDESAPLLTLHQVRTEPKANRWAGRVLANGRKRTNMAVDVSASDAESVASQATEQRAKVEALEAYVTMMNEKVRHMEENMERRFESSIRKLKEENEVWRREVLSSHRNQEQCSQDMSSCGCFPAVRSLISTRSGIKR